MSAPTIQVAITLESETCCNCGVVFGMESGHRHRLRQSHDWFYCPNGHGQHYTGKSEAQKANELAEWRARQLEYARGEAAAERDRRQAAERSRAAIKGQNTRLRRKVAAGQCPCCSERFPDLETHIADAHPDFEVSS